MTRREPEEILKDMIDNHKAMGDEIQRGCAAVSCVPMTLNYHGKMLYHSAELAEVSSYKVETLTRWLLRCTVALFVLTLALVAFTGVLAWLTWELVQHGH